MPYSDHFKLADDMIAHLNTVIATVSDPWITSRYIGFVAVAAVTVYELAIKDIFIEFCTNKHKVFGSFSRSHFERINGRIKSKTIRDEYIRWFGEKYVNRFNRIIDQAEQESLRNNRISIRSSYGNIITWRNEFAHAGIVPSTVTYLEVVNSYEAGKEVIHCLAKTMRR